MDAPSRLPVLNNPYYRNVLSEHGAFFAIANRIDRIHKNAWIGFQSWRATARKVLCDCLCLSYFFWFMLYIRVCLIHYMERVLYIPWNCFTREKKKKKNEKELRGMDVVLGFHGKCNS